jgi:hypothetical protein
VFVLIGLAAFRGLSQHYSQSHSLSAYLYLLFCALLTCISIRERFPQKC